MSHPISTSKEYIKKEKPSPYYERGGYDDDNEGGGYQSEDYQPNDSESRWYNILRKMSINIQRDEGTPDRDIVTGTAANPSDHERALMLNIPHSNGETFEDVNLPTVEECVAENAAEQPFNNYFENPFESDSTSTDDTLVKLNDDHNIHPLSAMNTKRKSEGHRTLFTSSSEELMQADTAQSKKHSCKHNLIDTNLLL
jgi:hypothetical protein